MLTVFASCCRLCISSFCSVAAAFCPSGVWKILFETCPVVMSRSFGRLQLEVAPASLMTVCWLGVVGDGMYMLFIFAASSTHAVSRVLWVNVVLTLFLSTVVLVQCCVLESAMDTIPHQSAFLFFLVSFCLLLQEFIISLWPLVFVLVKVVTVIILVGQVFCNTCTLTNI